MPSGTVTFAVAIWTGVLRGSFLFWPGVLATLVCTALWRDEVHHAEVEHAAHRALVRHHAFHDARKSAGPTVPLLLPRRPGVSTVATLVLAALSVPLWLAAVPVHQLFDGFDPSRVAGQRVLICGASSGIGEQLAYK